MRVVKAAINEFKTPGVQGVGTPPLPDRAQTGMVLVAVTPPASGKASAIVQRKPLWHNRLGYLELVSIMGLIGPWLTLGGPGLGGGTEQERRVDC